MFNISFIYILLLYQKADIFDMEGVDTIFTVDHIIDIQELISQYLLEYERKQNIIKCIISCNVSDIFFHSSLDYNLNTEVQSDENITEIDQDDTTQLPWIKSDIVSQVMNIWGDASEESYIDTQQGMK